MINNLIVSIQADKRVLYAGFEHKGITVPQGFTFNGNSIPKAFRFFLGQYDYLQASCVHDYLYNTKSDYLNVSRKEADIIYRDYLVELGYSKYKAYVCYGFVRIFGKMKFKAKPKKKRPS